jgi:DNA-binding MurR/RpiR family transcriptional regulator
VPVAAAGSQPPEASPLVRIRSLMPDLAPAERRVAAAVLADPVRAARSSITELAAAATTSETTVVRFCKAIGLRGYPDLRIALAADAARAEIRDDRRLGADITPTDDLAEVVGKVAFADARAVEQTARQLDVGVLRDVVAAVAAAGRVDIYGVGANALVAADLQQKLHRIGRVSFAWSDTHIMLTSAAVLTAGDVAIGLSHSGATADTVEALRVARGHGATTVALTSFPRAPIREVSDLLLTTVAPETTFRSGATASRIAQLTVVDCLFVGVAQRHLDSARRALKATYDAVGDHRLDLPAPAARKDG